MVIDSEYAKEYRERKRIDAVKAQWYRRKMLAAEEAGDCRTMRQLQYDYQLLTGEWFDTTLEWGKPMS